MPILNNTTIYLVLVRMKKGDAKARTWEHIGNVFYSKKAAENYREMGRSIFRDYAIAECSVELPKDAS